MRDLGFDRLRAQVENSTDLPEFHQVQRRARRIRRWHRVRTLVVVITVALPCAAVADAFYRAGSPASNIAITGDGSVVHMTLPTDPAPPESWTLIAADGVDLHHMYGLVDVCAASSCGLEISSIDPAGILGTTQRIDLFRGRSTDRITEPKVVAVDTSTVVVSARVNAGAAQTQMLRLTAMPTTAMPTTSEPATSEPATSIRVSARAVQTAESGAIQVANGAGGAGALPNQPPLSSPHLASTASGWWVCGTDPDTGAPALAVSRDDGATWELRPMGIDKVDAPPALVARGDTVYLLASSHDHLSLQKSTDSGRSWSALPGASGWPAAAGYGLVAARDESLVAWLSTSSGTVLMRSKDGGVTFTPYHGPGMPAGPIVTVSDGYLMLGSNPALSRDGVTWTAVTVPWLPLR